MPRRIFPAGSVANTTANPLRLSFHYTQTGDVRAGDLWTVDASNYISSGIPNGVVVTNSSGNYSAFAGPDDIDTLWVTPHTGAARTQITATGTVANGTTVDSGTYAPLQPGLAPVNQPPAQVGFGGRTVLTNNPGADGWTFSGTDASSVISDTTNALYGTCASLVTNGAGGQANLKKTGMTAMDLSVNDLEILLQIPDKTHLKASTFAVWVYLGNSSFASNYQAQLVRMGENYWANSGEWYRIRFTCPTTVSTGTPTRTGITDIQISVVDDNTGNKVTARIQQIALVPRSTNAKLAGGLVSFTLDDGYGSQWTNAMPKLAQYGYTATAYPIVDLLSTNGYLTLTQLKQLRDLMGWEIGGHAFTQANHNLTNGFGDLTTAQLAAELSSLKTWMRQNGFNSESFCYPRSGFTAATVDGVRKYFSNARTLAATPGETLPPVDPMRVRCRGFTSPADTLTQAQTLIDKTVAEKGWAVLCFHEVSDSPITASYVTTTLFNGIVDYVAGKGMPVVTVAEAMRTIAQA